MHNVERLRVRTGKPDAVIKDALESAKAAILARRYPFGDWPDELPCQYHDLQYRVALALIQKRGGDFETAHTENGISRTWGSEGIPHDLLAEIVPVGKVIR